MVRKLTPHISGKILYLQILGIIVICAGIFDPFFRQSPGSSHIDVIYIDFFTVILGITLVFPDLLEGAGKGRGIMGIAVFMAINILCLLALKADWNAISFRDRAADQYWLAIVGFAFVIIATLFYCKSNQGLKI